MLETNLAFSLGVFLEDALKETRFPTKSGSVIRAPKVFNGYLPPKRSQLDDDFPFVIVRAEDGTSDRGQTTATVSLIIGCYSEETDGYAYCLEIMEKIRLALCQLECQTLDRRFQLEFPITWANVTEQPYPQWQLVMTTKWVFNTPEMANF
ncbi:MAG: hypothetical protein ACI4SY_01730 [Sutterella sp.]